MTTTAIQTHVGIDNDMKVLLENVLTQAATGASKATIITDLGVLRTAIVYILGALDAQAAVINAGLTNAVTTNASGHTPAAITTV